MFHEQHSCGNVFVIRPSTPQWLVQASVSAPRTVVHSVVPMYFILLHFAGSCLLALFNTLPFPYHLIAQLFSLQTCPTIPSESSTRILFMRACILSGFAIPGDAHGIRLLYFVFGPFLGLLLSCRCQARGSCHKAAKPWPSIPCTLLGRRKELAFFSIFQHLQCFLTQVVSGGLRTARDIMHFSRRQAESSKSAKWMNLRTAFSIFFPRR